MIWFHLFFKKTLDKDNASQRASEALYNKLINEGYQIINYSISANKKDFNELLILEPQKLKNEIRKALCAIKKSSVSKSLMKDYIANFITRDNKKQEKLSSSIAICNKGRPTKNAVITEEIKSA